VSRLFTFGCSFTQYFWPTWADILGREFSYFENWGRQGAVNQFIFNSLVECLLRNRLTDKDTVVIMWSNVLREDRYIGGQWETHGNAYTARFFKPDFLRRYFDPKGCLIRDLAVIYAARQILESQGIRTIFLSMVPITNPEQYQQSEIRFTDSVCEIYKETIDFIRPSVFETVFNFDWHSLRPEGSYDLHPTPLEHLKYLDLVVPEISISQATRQWAEQHNKDTDYQTAQPTIRF